jgi:hypothetical protein
MTIVTALKKDYEIERYRTTGAPYVKRFMERWTGDPKFRASINQGNYYDVPICLTIADVDACVRQLSVGQYQELVATVGNGGFLY